jgi:hypothetical protein
MTVLSAASGEGAASCTKACYARSMCIICIDFERGALRPKEARRALREMRGGLDATHIKEIEKKLDEAEPPSSPRPGG